jgi:uncharacterized OB-fold protein
MSAQGFLPPVLRSRPALGLTARAAEGRFALPWCPVCERAHYPPQEVCPHCLHDAPGWRDAEPAGRLLAEATVHQSLEPWFQARVPFRTGLVAHPAGVTLVAFVHRDVAPGGAVALRLRLAPGGMAVVLALPRDGDAVQEDPAMADYDRSVTGRSVLVAGEAAVAAACAAAAVRAGAGRVWLAAPPGAAVPAGAAGLTLDPGDPASLAAAVAALDDGPDCVILALPRGGDDWAAAPALHSAFARALGPALAARGGTWVSILSAAAFAPSPATPAACAGMAAADAMARALRADLLAAGGHLLAVYPGPLDVAENAAQPGPKLPPARLAAEILAALAAGQEDLLPDPVARDLHARLRAEPKALERDLAAVPVGGW